MGENVDMIQIEVRRLHSRTYIVPVEKQQFILGLKEQLAVVSGIISERQRLLFRGRVLINNRRLSDYQIENGHTLFLVVELPNPQTENGNGGAGSILRRHRYFDPFPVQPDQDPNVVVIPDALTLLRNYRDEVQRSGNNPGRLAWIEQRRRELLIGEIGQSLYSISEILATRVDHTIPQTQSMEQGRATESDVLTMNFGNTLIELGRAISRIVRGEILRTILLELYRRLFPPPTGQSNQPQAQTRTAPRNIEITRHIGLRFIWPPVERAEASDAASSQPNVSSSEAQNAVNNPNSPQLTTDEVLSDSDPEDEMVNIVTRLHRYSKEEMFGVF